MTVTESEWNARAGERAAAAKGDPAAWESLFGRLWVWSTQVAGSGDGAMAGWTNVVRYPRLWLQPLPLFATVFKNAARSEARRERRHQRRVAALWASGQHPAVNTVEGTILIKELLRHLSPPDRRLMLLYIEGLTITDLAEACGLTYTTARRRVHAAGAALRDVLSHKKQARGTESAVTARGDAANVYQGDQK